MQIQYKPKRNLLETILQVEILQGLGLTLRRLFSKPVTRQYPHEKPKIRLGFRGQHALVRDPATGQIVAQVAVSGASEAGAAVDAAQAAFAGWALRISRRC